MIERILTKLMDSVPDGEDLVFTAILLADLILVTVLGAVMLVSGMFGIEIPSGLRADGIALFLTFAAFTFGYLARGGE